MEFIETILITNKIENLELHNKRMNNTRYIFFKEKPIDLKEYIKIIKNKRIRVTYDRKIKKVEYFDLVKKEFKKFKIVHSDIDYSYKFANREELNKLKEKNVDEVIIVKNGFITDTTISNLAFFDGKKWITPKNPLLKGTKREELLNKNFLIQKDIKVDEIKNFKKFAMINAIVGFLEIDIKAIIW